MEPSRRAAADACRVVRSTPPAASRSTEDWTSGSENPVVATVLPRRVHHPLHALRIRPGRQLAGGREHEARARARGVDAALHLGLDLSLGRPLEDRHVDIADRDHAPLVAERDQPVELIDLERGIALLIEVDRDRDEADVDQVLMDLVRRPANVNGRANLLRLEIVYDPLT